MLRESAMLLWTLSSRRLVRTIADGKGGLISSTRRRCGSDSCLVRANAVRSQRTTRTTRGETCEGQNGERLGMTV
ncbi:hypothetical protein FA95DRAFT_1551769 [Auriscalpium vulgare]|uniref:Uncharacterized protein n=1 Tax=Auriscalpium vulgare TaxID=40419 RepID=A0ACB8SDH2_9AGAM|nr:hypothetical protein FA95DRAFT_1551769 [Auriscalpium vulgare]